MKLCLSLALALRAAAAVVVPEPQPCPYHRLEHPDLKEDSYVVTLKKGHTLEEHFDRIGMDLSEMTGFMYSPVGHTYLVDLNSDFIHSRIRFDPGVEHVEHDYYLAPPDSHLTDPEGLDGEKPVASLPALPHVTKKHQRRSCFFSCSRFSEEVIDLAPWWLAQITAGKKDDSLTASSQTDSTLFRGAGEGVDIYILDSGIKLDHVRFQPDPSKPSRATNFQGKSTSPYTGSTANDLDGHGTHVASIAGMVAPYANIVNVKVECARTDPPEPNCNPGTAYKVSLAFEAITSLHNSKKNKPPRGWTGSVINTSLRTPPSQALSDAIGDAFKAGIPIAAAVGNNHSDDTTLKPGQTSPYGPGLPCTSKKTQCVGASTSLYRYWDLANFGKSINIVAPGAGVTAAGIKSTTSEDTRYGTSQASPMVAGVMAMYVGFESIRNNAQLVYDRLASNTLSNVLVKVPANTVNNLLNTGINNPHRGWMWPYAGPYVPHELRRGATTSEAQGASTAAGADDGTTLATATTYGDPLGYALVSTVMPTVSTAPIAYHVRFTPSLVTDPAPASSAISTELDIFINDDTSVPVSTTAPTSTTEPPPTSTTAKTTSTKPLSTACPAVTNPDDPPQCSLCPNGFIGLSDPGTKCAAQTNSVGFSQVLCKCNDPCGSTTCNLYAV